MPSGKRRVRGVLFSFAFGILRSIPLQVTFTLNRGKISYQTAQALP
jgi:hypothetical protein